MSLKLYFNNIAAHIYSFRNIDLWDKGHYYCEIMFYVQTANAKYFAKPITYE